MTNVSQMEEKNILIYFSYNIEKTILENATHLGKEKTFYWLIECFVCLYYNVQILIKAQTFNE